MSNNKVNKRLNEPWQDPDVKPFIEIKEVTKKFGDFQAVRGVSLSIYKGEFFSLLGGSGCGKTTLLRMLAGFETPTSGNILIDGKDITHLPPYKRPVNMMFQSYALFPHMNVYKNIAFGLQQEGVSSAEIKDRVEESLSLVQMSGYDKRMPEELSGGQRQRVALARSLIKKPQLLLLDEPLAALDKKLRERTQFELVNIQEKVGITFVMVTHDQEEAMTMSSRMAIMQEGLIRQIGMPHDVYEYPSSKFTAEFIGNTNIFKGIVVEDEHNHSLVESPETELPLYLNHGAPLPLGSEVFVSIRPEKVRIAKVKSDHPSASGPGNHNCAKGIVKEIGYLGDMSIYHVELTHSGKRVQAAMPNQKRLSERDVSWDDEVYIYWKAENGVILTN